MRTNKKLQLEQLDRKISPFMGTDKIIIPAKGWINSIRTSINMKLEQLGSKLNITRQGAKKIEESESLGTISIKSLKEVAEVLNLKLVYCFVPQNGSLENLINSKAEQLAKKIVLRTSKNMKLENQGNSEEKKKRAKNDLTSK